MRLKVDWTDGRAAAQTHGAGGRFTTFPRPARLGAPVPLPKDRMPRGVRWRPSPPEARPARDSAKRAGGWSRAPRRLLFTLLCPAFCSLKVTSRCLSGVAALRGPAAPVAQKDPSFRFWSWLTTHTIKIKG